MNTASPSPPGISQTIERFVRDIGRIAEDDTYFNNSAELFDSGYIDSLGIVTLTASIEQAFSITLTEDDLFDPRFTTITGIAAIVAARRAERRLPTPDSAQPVPQYLGGAGPTVAGAAAPQEAMK